MYLVIGASSFIGRHLYEYCKKNQISVLGTYYMNSNNPEWVRFDLRTGSLEDINGINGKKDILDAVIICGANTSIDSCKSDEVASYELNVIGTKRIFEQADKMGIKCVFLSSEAVFDGKKGRYREEDIPNPITLYGKQKLQVEQYICQNIRKHLIFRISRAVGSQYGEKDIFNEFYSKILYEQEIICLKDQKFCITEINDIVQAIVKALDKDINGVYHLSSDNYISRYELANLFAEKVFGGYEKIVEKEYGEIDFLDNRHIYGGLNGDKLKDLLNIRFMDINAILDSYVATYKSGTRI